MALDENVVVVVDDHDNVLEHVLSSKMGLMQRRRDTGIIITNDKGEILIAQRSFNKKMLPGYWGVACSGTVESRESYEQNAHKELEEELGLIDVDLTFIGNFLFDYSDFKRISGLFTATWNGDISDLTLQESEVSAAKWVTPQRMKEMILDDNTDVVESMTRALNLCGIDIGLDSPEFAHVVDKNDNLLCYRDRTTLTPSDIMRIAVIWIEDGMGNALIHKRASVKAIRPDVWQSAAGGGIASYETPEQSAYKELSEEIGLNDTPLKFVDKTLITTSTGQRWVYWYTGKSDKPAEGFKIEPREVAEVKWVKKQELFATRDKNPDDYMPATTMWRQLFDK